MTPGTLEAELAASAAGDAGAFMRFYDATSGYAFALSLCRARGRGLRGEAATAAAAGETEARYATAWRRSAEHAGSGLSALAWLLTLPSDDTHAEPVDVVACA